MKKIKTCATCYFFNECLTLCGIDGEDESCQGYFTDEDPYLEDR